MKHITALTLAALMGTTAAPALAQSQGDMLLGLGLHGVIPKDNNGVLANGTIPIDVDENIRPSVTFEYFVADNIGIEVLAAWPFEHDINSGGTRIGEIKHLPPTVSLQYHFSNASNVTPFIGAGLNYTFFFDETAKGPIAGNQLSLDDSWGVALHAGADFAISESASLRADVRWIDIESDVKLNGQKIGKAKIDPWVVGLAYVVKF
ncbi:OmpW/AlkL family protein [Roseovarius tibetensis]|uniref:OmpW/AlkL family protein n=1 Tax=Roseovarius tibetensis TaxID=2685897 RepID=UPI003D7FF4D8